MAKYGLGYNLATAEIRNKKEMNIRIVHGKYFLKFSIYVSFLKNKACANFKLLMTCYLAKPIKIKAKTE